MSLSEKMILNCETLQDKVGKSENKQQLQIDKLTLIIESIKNRVYNENTQNLNPNKQKQKHNFIETTSNFQLEEKVINLEQELINIKDN